MKLSSLGAKIVGVLLAALTALFNLFPSNLLYLGDTQSEALLQKTGGFMAGVCHPKPEMDMIKDAGLGWIRVDIPYLYAEDGSGEINPYYEYWKLAAAEYASSGIKILAVTPYPHYYEQVSGIDITTEEGLAQVADIARYYCEDLKGIVGAFQITNEMGVDRFTKNVTMEQAARFIGVQAEAMNDIKGDIVVGYNLGGAGFVSLPFQMNKYKEYIDYVGVDIYLGCFENFVKNPDLTFVLMNAVRMVTGKPIILMEFGYISYGEAKTKEEKTAILQQYGVSSEAEARKDIDAFIARLPEKLRIEFETLYADRTDEEKADLLFKGEYANHIYRELSEGTGLWGYPHTPEGQGKFYSHMFKRIKKIKWCVGAMIYMWDDTATCYVCNQPDCPVETGWGIVDGEGKLKPAYYAVQKAFAN